jgi:hypothetical protein
MEEGICARKTFHVLGINKIGSGKVILSLIAHAKVIETKRILSCITHPGVVTGTALVQKRCRSCSGQCLQTEVFRGTTPEVEAHFPSLTSSPKSEKKSGTVAGADEARRCPLASNPIPLLAECAEGTSGDVFC